MANPKDFNQTEESENSQSRINAAGLINSTLERLWVDCYNAMSQGNYLLWNTKLDSIWAILGGDVDEGGTEDTNITTLNTQIYEQGSFKSKTGTGFNKQINPKLGALYQLLLKKSLFLRRLQNSQGKGTAYKTDDDHDFD